MSKENVSATVDPEVAEFLDQEHINRSATINKAMKMYMAAGEGEMAALRIRRDNLRSSIRKRENNLQDDKTELERVEDRLAEIQDSRKSEREESVEIYAEHVQLSERSSAGLVVDTPEEQVEELAEKAGVSVDELIAVAKDNYNA